MESMAYVRLDHMRVVVDECQGTCTGVPPEVIEEVKACLLRANEDCTPATVRLALRQLKMTRYFAESVTIYCALRCLDLRLPYDVYNGLMQHFQDFSQKFDSIRDGRSFPNYRHIAHLLLKEKVPGGKPYAGLFPTLKLGKGERVQQIWDLTFECGV